MKNIRTKIIDSAIKLFTNNHYSDIGIREVAKAININHSTILYYFKNKEELFLEVLRNIIKKVKCENKDWINLIINFDKEKYNKEQSFEYLSNIIKILINKILLQKFDKYKKLMFKNLLKLESSKLVVYNEFEKPLYSGFIDIIRNIIDIDVNDIKLYILPSMIIGQITGMVDSNKIFLKTINRQRYDPDITKIIVDMLINQTKIILNMYDMNNKNNKND